MREFLVLLMAAITVGQTATAAPTMVILGIGQRTCSDFLDTVETNRKVNPNGGIADAASGGYGLFMGFADGYVTGHNAYAANHTLLDGGLGGRMRWLENYCRANPLQKYAIAVASLTQALVANDH